MDQKNGIQASVILAHPYSRSFNHAIYETALRTFRDNGVKVFNHDLYREKFNPVLTEAELGKKPSRDRLVLRYTAELMESDVLVFIHPNWWGQPPAILKGYIDRVIRPPHAYEFAAGDSGGGIPEGKLAGKYGIVFNTSNTAPERENGYFHDPLESIWIKCLFGFCGMENCVRKTFRIVSDSKEPERAEWLNEVRSMIGNALVTTRGATTTSPDKY